VGAGDRFRLEPKNDRLRRMSSAIRERLEVFRDIAGRPWFRTVGLIWFCVGAWDLTLSQFVPEEYSRNFPKLYQVVGMTAGWISLGAWLMLGALLVVAGAVEWALRHKKRYLDLLHQSSITPGAISRDLQFESFPIPGGIIAARDLHWQFDSQMADAIATRLRSKPEWQDKTIVDVTPEYLWNLFRERTTRQSSKDAERFLNKWMVVCGPFGDVTSPIGNQILVTFATRAILEIVLMYFSKDWECQLELITPDKKIAVVGRIESVMSRRLQLEDCELVQ